MLLRLNIITCATLFVKVLVLLAVSIPSSSEAASDIFKSSPLYPEVVPVDSSNLSSFQIQSSEPNIGGQNLCIEASSLAIEATLTIQICSSVTSGQMFSVDEYGRINVSDDPTYCISKVGANGLQIALCGEPVNRNMFAYNSVESTLNWKKNGFKVFSVDQASPVVGRQVVLGKRGKNANTDMQNWKLKSVDGTVLTPTIPGTFLIQNMKTSSSNEDLCGEPTAFSSGAVIKVKKCETNNSIQQWEVDNRGRVYPVDDENLCIHRAKKGKLLLASCTKATKFNMMMYNAFDRSVLLKKSGFQGFTLANDAAILDKKIRLAARKTDLSKVTQQWTLNEGESVNIIDYVGNPCGSNGECTICQGDCDEDSDCNGELRCAQRTKSTGVENVPGCAWGADPDGRRFENDDYCFQPQTVENKVINYVGECDPSSYLCKECEGDCDNDEDCEGNLICEQRSGHEAITGCSGEGSSIDLYAKDICVSSGQPEGPPPNSLTIRAEVCSSANPCDECEGSCSGNTECLSGLTCFVRSGLEPVPNCVTGGTGDMSDTNYCHERPPVGDTTYIPGDLTTTQNGLLLSTGLASRIIATTGTFVSYDDGSVSNTRFHENPDGAAVFPITSGSNNGGWYYVSNSEDSYSSTSSTPRGGVGALTFKSDGNVINYEIIVENTSDNCGGGKTYWNTWVTCEEFSGGQVHEVDPFTGLSSQQQTVLGNSGGKYESFSYDARNLAAPTFYVTHDSSSGGMVRFTADSVTVAAANSSGDYSNVLTTMGNGKIEWLVLNPEAKTFSWTSNRSTGDSNASKNYPNSEGIDIRNGMLYFVTKGNKRLFILDLDNLTYEVSSTRSGAFDGQPDQVARIIADDPDSDMLYFCEEAGADNGVHARDSDGHFYTILTGDSVTSETTGLSFSPDNKHMYVSYQSDGIIYDITRTDGYQFGAHRLDIKYHAS